MASDLAVVVRNAYKKYEKNGAWVLKNLNMNIPQNQIYGLLGSSGCGKTTLLRSLVGAQDLDHGSIQLKVTAKRDVGFMPQETALFEEFSIAESFRFYANLYRISREQLHARIKELSDVLDLPPDNRICGTLSGGQLRRVSIAVTLLHSPSLVILDEPTSGLDPLLADMFWRYLKRLSVNGQTIIITTHYIEEARQANMVGLMRHGVILAEDHPEALIAQYQVDSLEDVFLCLCHKQTAELPEPEPEKKIPFAPLYQNDSIKVSEFWAHTKAILYKNIKWIQRNWPTFISLYFALSVACIVESNECLKYFPTMRVGIVNHGAHGDCADYPDYRAYNCSGEVDLSCHFIQIWQTEKPEIQLLRYDHFEDAMRDGKDRKLISILEIPYNFTLGALDKFENGWRADSDLVETSSIDIRIDSTDFMAIFKLEQDVREVMDSMFKTHLSQCGYNPGVGNIPPMRIIKDKFMGPGIEANPYDYTTHISMGIILSITYVSPVVVLTMSLCLEKMTGAYTRSLLGGVKIVEIFSGYIITLMVFNAINSTIMLFLQCVVYGKPYGTLWLTYLLINTLGLTGILFGLFVIVVTRSLTESAGIAIATNLSMYSFTGFIWPIEAAVLPIIKPISSVLFPLTLSLKAIFSIMWKDASILNEQVLYGFMICFLHGAFYVGSMYLIIKIRKTL